MENIIRSSIALIVLFIFMGFIRIYYGGGVGFKVVPKNSYSYVDTIVNLDNIFGMPRIIVAAQHPAVKKQLEEMGILETDERIKQRIQSEFKEKIRQHLEEYYSQSGR